MMRPNPSYAAEPDVLARSAVEQAVPTTPFEIVVRPSGTDGLNAKNAGPDLEFVVVEFLDHDPILACQRALLYARRTFGPRELVASVLPPRKD